MNAATEERGMTNMDAHHSKPNPDHMNPRIILLLLSCCLSFAGPAAQAAGDKPNIIVFLADDMGYGDPQ